MSVFYYIEIVDTFLASRHAKKAKKDEVKETSESEEETEESSEEEDEEEEEIEIDPVPTQRDAKGATKRLAIVSF